MTKLVSTVALLAIASNLLVAGGDIAPVEPVVPEVVVSDEWKFNGIVYLWGAALKGTTTSGSKLDISFSDIVDNLDFGIMGVIGAQKGKWGFSSDILYLDISKDVNVPLEPPVELTNIGIEGWVVTPIVSYRVVESEQLSLDLLAGARYLYLKSPMEFNNAVSTSEHDDMWDGIVGVKGEYEFNEKWYMPFRFDVGTGDSDVTWQAFAGVGYKYENFDFIAGYRYLDWEFEDSDPALGMLTDLDLSGPVIGAKFNF